MSPERHGWLADRAYDIWQKAGYPEGQAVQHWLQAEEELCEAERMAPLCDPVLPLGAQVKPATRDGQPERKRAKSR